MGASQELIEELAAAGRRLRDLVPDVYGGYARLHAAAMSADGVLPVKTKELIALAVAVTRECDGCVAAHAKGAARAGATREEVAEAMGVAILLNGGPATVWGPRALAAFNDFAAPPEPAQP